MRVLENSKMFSDCTEATDEMTIDKKESKYANPNVLCDDQNESNGSPTPSTTNTTDNGDVEINESLPDMNSPEDFKHKEYNNYSSLKHINVDAEQKSRSCSPQKAQQILSPVRGELLEDADTKFSERSENNSHQSDYREQTRTESPKIEESVEENVKATEEESLSTSVSPSNVLPRLRLNALLASDPALKPDAKDLKTLHEESHSKQNRLALNSAALNKQDTTPDNIQSLESIIKPPTHSIDTPRMKVFMCLPCGIGFSSPSTLDAHQAYYCSHRNKEVDEENASIGSAMSDKITTVGGSNMTVSGNPLNNCNMSNSGSVAEPVTKSIKTGKQYACNHCSYSADKKVSLNRHMRMHQTSPAPNSNALNGTGIGNVSLDDNSSQQIDRYCSDCDIRFNNVKTYRAHKLHYCSSRRTDGQTTPKLEGNSINSGKNINMPEVSATSSAGLGGHSPQNRTKTPTPAMVAAAAAAATLQPQAQPFLALPTNPILIIPYSLIPSASLIPGQLAASLCVSNPESTCFILSNGSLKPLATALNLNPVMGVGLKGNASEVPEVLSKQLPNTQEHTVNKLSNNDNLLTEKNDSKNMEIGETTPKRKEKSTRESAPLDLSIPRSQITAILQRQQREMEKLIEGKENLSVDECRSITPEHIVCAPSLPNSPSMSPSPKRRTLSPRSSGAGSTSSVSPPVSNVSLAANFLENLPLRSMLPAELSLPITESALMNPLAKQKLELMFKLSAAAAAAANSNATGLISNKVNPTPAELAAAAVVSGTKQSLLSLPVLSGANAAGAIASSSSGQPQMYVKQGVSKCKECNIVFCKYENYLAHKQHYCSARNHEISSDGEAKVSNTPPIVGAASTAETTPVAYQQLICAACGIKYTSLDNLRAHQNYYCPKGGGNASATNTTSETVSSLTEQIISPKEKCGKCKTVHDVGIPCVPLPSLQPSPVQQQTSSLNTITGNVNHQNVYKCPVCDVVSLTSSENRKHMETHGSVKAFRCSICRYKGNTLRGMRTHIRMHFDKKTSEFNEEHYMSCILEDEGIEIPSAAAVQQQQQLQQAAAVVAGLQNQQQIFNCELCSYTSTYKGNVIRHMKSAHPHVPLSSPSISPDVGDIDMSDAGSIGSSINGDVGNQSFTIKTEPPEINSTILSNAYNINTAHDNNNSPIPQSPRSTTKLPIPSILNTNELLIQQIKSEPLDNMDSGITDLPLSIPPPSQSSRQIVHGLTGPMPQQPPPPLNASPDENNSIASALNQKYCQTCDISFNYMKTYLAHKQYYCKNKIGRSDTITDDSSSPNLLLTPISGSPNTLLIQKNKENLQQEAAI